VERGEIMLEKDIEHKLVMEVKRVGGLALKFTSPGMVGVPDRIILMPNGKIAFAELKAPGKKPRAIQVKRINQIRQLGFKVYVIDNTQMIGGVIDEIQAT
jgi:hypothetical protein